MSSLDTLIQKLAGAASSASTSETSSAQTTSTEATLTDPVYVEKLASAVDFIIDTWGSQPEEVGTQTRPTELVAPTQVKTAAPVEEVPAEETKIESVAQISELLKTKLQTKLASKREVEIAKSEAKGKELAEAVLGKLLQLKGGVVPEDVEVTEPSQEEEDVIRQSFYSDTDNSNEYEEPTSDSNEADGGAAIKAASADQSLADVLNAALGTDEQSIDSAPKEGTKTAGVRGSDGSSKTRKAATHLLKKKLLAKAGEEAQS